MKYSLIDHEVVRRRWPVCDKAIRQETHLSFTEEDKHNNKMPSALFYIMLSHLTRFITVLLLLTKTV